MTIDIYCYLLSSLIQVFGTLVVGDVVFLVLLYQYLEKKHETARRQLNLKIAMITRDGAWRNDVPKDPINTKANAEAYDYFTEPEIETQLQKALDIQLRGITEEQSADKKKPMIERLERLHSMQSHLAWCREQIENLKGRIRWIMGVPAGASIVFYSLLSNGYQYQKSDADLLRQTIIAGVLAIFFFCWIIRLAISIWPHDMIIAGHQSASTARTVQDTSSRAAG